MHAESLYACVRAIVLAVAMALVLALSAAIAVGAAEAPKPVIDGSTGVDHDGRPIAKPKERVKSPYGHAYRESFVEPISHGLDIPDKLLALARAFGADNERQAANVNAFDEVPNSTWFTNRNHIRAVDPDSIRIGPGGEDIAPVPPLKVVGFKESGVTVGFTIKDAKDKRWAIKLDSAGYPRLTSGADAIVTRLFWAAGYNVPYDVPIKLKRNELTIDDEMVAGKDGAPPFGPADLDTLLSYGHRAEDGTFYGQASLFLAGEPVGIIDSRGRRPDDPNDMYSHQHRRELRGLDVLSSWVGSWDTKDHQTFDSFIETTDSLGYVRHHLLDVGASLGAAGEGPKKPDSGYEHYVDFKWTLRRLVTFGFVVEPWRRAQQETGVPSVGNFESAVYEPEKFRTYQPHPAFRERTRRDGYWGAKLVASFSDAQIAAAIDAARFDDPRAKPMLLQLLRERRDKVARHWFARVAPLEYFHVEGERLAFHDLAVDRGLELPRRYVADVDDLEGDARSDELTTSTTSVDLTDLGPDVREVELSFRVENNDADPARVRLVRREGGWSIVRVIHG